MVRQSPRAARHVFGPDEASDPKGREVDPELADHPNVQKYLQILQALKDQDLLALQSLLATDAHIEMAGRNPFSGVYPGIGASMALAGRTRRRFCGQTVRIDSADGDEVLATVTVIVATPTGRTETFALRHRYVFRDGKAVSALVWAEDQEDFDAFLNEV